jgi:hypothetical protein
MPYTPIPYTVPAHPTGLSIRELFIWLQDQEKVQKAWDTEQRRLVAKSVLDEAATASSVRILSKPAPILKPIIAKTNGVATRVRPARRVTFPIRVQQGTLYLFNCDMV